MKSFTKKLSLLLIALFSLAYYSQAQSLFAKFNTGYNFGLGAYYSSENSVVGNSTTYETKKINLNRGFNFGGAVGYSFNKFIAAELGLNYILGSTTTIKNTFSNENFTLNFMLRTLNVVPAICLSPGFDKINPYVRLGLIIGKTKVTTIIERETFTSGFPDLSEETIVYSGGLAVGSNSAIGIDYKINNHFSLNGELNFTNLSYSPKISEITESKTNGVDMLPTMSTRDKKTEYVDSYEVYSNVPVNKDAPRQETKSNFPINNSIGLNLGLKYSF